MYIAIDYPAPIAPKEAQQKYHAHMRAMAEKTVDLVTYVFRNFPEHFDWVLNHDLTDCRYKRLSGSRFELFKQFPNAKRGIGMRMVFSRMPKRVVEVLPK